MFIFNDFVDFKIDGLSNVTMIPKTTFFPFGENPPGHILRKQKHPRKLTFLHRFSLKTVNFGGKLHPE